MDPCVARSLFYLNIMQRNIYIYILKNIREIIDKITPVMNKVNPSESLVKKKDREG